MTRHFTLFLLISSSIVFGQDPRKLDSLASVWNKSSLPDTTRLNALNALSLCFKKSNPDSALSLAFEQIEFAQKSKQRSPEAKAYYTIGDIYYSRGNHQTAIEYYQKSLNTYISLKDVNKCSQILHQMGVVEYYNTSYNKALEYHLQALSIYEESMNEEGIADCFHDIGKVFYRQKQYDQALKSYQESLDRYNKLGNKHGAASSLNNMAGVYGDKEEYEKMLDYLKRSLKLTEELGEKHGSATRLHNIGFVYQKIKKYDPAMSYFEKGLRIREEMGDKKGISYSLNSMGQVYSDKGDQPMALEFLSKSLEIAKETKIKEVVKSAYEELSKVYYRMNKYKDAYDYHSLLMGIKDSIFTEKSSLQIAEMQTKFETVKNEKAMQLQRSQLNVQDMELVKQRNEKFGLFIGLSLLILLAVVLVRSNKNKQRAHTIISRQKKIVEEQKEAVEKQKKEVEIQKLLIEENQKEMIDSITYAGRIQRSLLPTEKYIDRTLKRLNGKRE